VIFTSFTKICTLNLLKEEMKEYELLFSYLMPRKSTDSLFISREAERYFKNLINSHLFKNKFKFLKFFSFSRVQFDFLLLLVELENYQ